MSISTNTVTTKLMLKEGNQMIVIFGWGHRTTKELGQKTLMYCPNCRNDRWWHLISYKTWFTLFFIPVIPYESKHLLYCGLCSHGVEIKRNKINEAKELLRQNVLVSDKQV